MTVKRQRLLTLFLTLQKRSTLIWKWEQPTHGKGGQEAKWKASRSRWRCAQAAGSSPCTAAPRDPEGRAHHLWTDFYWRGVQRGDGADKGLAGKKFCSRHASFIFDEESPGWVFLLPTQWLMPLTCESAWRCLWNNAYSVPSPEVGQRPHVTDANSEMKSDSKAFALGTADTSPSDARSW